MSLLKTEPLGQVEEDLGKDPKVRRSSRVGARAKTLVQVGELDRQKSLVL